MKNKTISITDELYDLLKNEVNASKLICDLLIDHFEHQSIRKLTPEERDRRMKILEIEIEAEKKIKELENEVKN